MEKQDRQERADGNGRISKTDTAASVCIQHYK
jgi:hypothetical protein